MSENWKRKYLFQCTRAARAEKKLAMLQEHSRRDHETMLSGLLSRLDAMTTLQSLIAELDASIPGIQDAYAANGAEGLVKFILTWAWEDAERALREEAAQ